MTESPHTRIQVPRGWDADACRAWAQGQRQQAVQLTLRALNRQAVPSAPSAQAAHPAHAPDATRLTLQAGYYLFLIGDLPSAAALLGHRHQADPDHTELSLNLAVVLQRLGRLEQALPLLEQVARQTPDHAAAHDGLATCLHRLGRLDAAAAAGRRSLELKHRQRQPPPPGWRLPDGDPQTFASQPGKRQLIAFSLWGRQPTYLRGALRNVLLAADLCPGWVPQFHVDDSVPADFLALIQRLGAEVVRHPPGQTLRQRLCWRFAVANDPDVGRFLVRDADSVISLREALAVRQWCESERWFHVMRDWWSHTDLMLAGLWGGVAGVLPDLAALLRDYRPATAETPNIDQWFLRDRVWGCVSESVLVHDRCFATPGSQPFPGPDPVPGFHVGQDEHAVKAEWQARWLAPWLDACPSLRDDAPAGVQA